MHTLASDHSTLLQHLTELRKRLLRSFLALAGVFLSLVNFSANLYHFVARPLLQQLPKGAHIIATTLVSPFFAPLKLTLFIALFIAMPYILSQIWQFISPALYPQEKKFGACFLSIGIALFYLGVGVNYYWVAPRVFAFFIHHTPKGVVMMTDIHHYINFILSLSLALGLVLETPLIVCLMVTSGWVSRQRLTHKRKYVFVGSFIIAMVIVPPDVLTQVVAATAIYTLFELGLFATKFYPNRKRNENT